MNPHKKRRDFLKQSLAGVFGVAAATLPSNAAEPRTRPAADDGYRALVCVLLEGGADTFNMIVPRRKKSYEKYRKLRRHLAVARDSLLPIDARYGLRGNMGEMQRLYREKKLAVVANVGTLVEPVTPRQVREGSKKIPFELFAHNTQRDQWMFGDATGRSRTGWAARATDRLYPVSNPARSYCTIDTADVNTLLFSGGRKDPLHLTEPNISPDTMRRYGFGPESGGGAFGRVYQHLYALHQLDRNPLQATMARQRIRELNLPVKLEGLFDGVRDFDGFTTGVHEVGKPLGSQLELVAQTLSVKDRFPGRPRRQIFFVDHHNWDTHDSDNEHQTGYLSDSLGAFQKAMEELGMESEVTVLTLSDFGRSLTPNGAGTDHGWGTHAFVMGGAVKGGKIYGKMPRIERDSPDAWYDRLVPALSMESYLATLLAWMGLSKDELDLVLPNLRSFPTRDLGFMRG
ncbi:DUF1501 domain-containing protein [Nitratifractor sp.]